MKTNSLTITFKTEEGQFDSKGPGRIHDDLAFSTICDALKAAGIKPIDSCAGLDPEARGWDPDYLTIDVVDQYRKDEDGRERWCVTANVTPYDFSQVKMKTNALTITFKTDEGKFYSKTPGFIYDDLAHSTIWAALEAAGIDPNARGWNPNDLTIDVVDQYCIDEDRELAAWGEDHWRVTANVAPYDFSQNK